MTERTDSATPEADNGPDHNGAEQATKSTWNCDDMQSKVATVGVIVVAAALVEVALVPGMIIGVAATLAPKYVPQMANAMGPAFRSIVRGAYKFGRKAREAAAEAKEQVHDIVAEVHAETNAPPAGNTQA